MRFVPGNKQPIPHRQRSPMIRRKIIEIIHTPGQRRINMSHDLPLKILLRLKLVKVELFPETSGLGRDGGRDDFNFFLAVAGGRARVVSGADGKGSRLGDCVDAHLRKTAMLDGMVMVQGGCRRGGLTVKD
jgi:hypothetical protein